VAEVGGRPAAAAAAAAAAAGAMRRQEAGAVMGQQRNAVESLWIILRDRA